MSSVPCTRSLACSLINNLSPDNQDEHTSLILIVKRSAWRGFILTTLPGDRRSSSAYKITFASPQFSWGLRACSCPTASSHAPWLREFFEQTQVGSGSQTGTRVTSPGTVLAPHRTADSNSGDLVEKEIKRGNPAIARNDEITPGVSWRLTRPAGHPADQPAIARFRRLRTGLISEFRVSSLDRPCDSIDLVAPTIDSLARVVENAIFGVELVNCVAPASGIIFSEDITKIADQQG